MDPAATIARANEAPTRQTSAPEPSAATTPNLKTKFAIAAVRHVNAGNLTIRFNVRAATHAGVNWAGEHNLIAKTAMG